MSSNYLALQEIKFFGANVEGHWDEDDYMDIIVDYTIILQQSEIEDHIIILADDADIEDNTILFS